MNTIRVSPWLWVDDEFRQLPPEFKLGWLYLLLGPDHRLGIDGLFVLNEWNLAHAMDRCSADDVSQFLTHIQDLRWIEYHKQTVRIVRCFKYSALPNSNTLKSWWVRWKSMPRSGSLLTHAAALAYKLNGRHEDVWRTTFGTIDESSIDFAIRRDKDYQLYMSREVNLLKRFGSPTPKKLKGAGERNGLGQRKRILVLDRDGFCCVYCGRRPPEVELVVDHKIPVALGGTDDDSNLAAACFDCNSGKGALLLSNHNPEIAP